MKTHVSNLAMSLYVSGYRHLRKEMVEKVGAHACSCDRCGQKFDEYLDRQSASGESKRPST